MQVQQAMSLFIALSRNVAETSPTAEDPRLRTRLYSLSRETVWNTIQQLAGLQQGWKVIKLDSAAGLLEAEARTRLLKFVDDVTIRVSTATSERVSVDVHSRSRVGKGDLGTNARRIGKFLEELDSMLAPTQR